MNWLRINGLKRLWGLNQLYLRKGRLYGLRGARYELKGLIELSAPPFVLPISFVVPLSLPSVFFCKIRIFLVLFFEAVVCHGHVSLLGSRIRGTF
jgi:hypothetical protein